MDYDYPRINELLTNLCYLFWDIFNMEELRALSPSESHPTAIQYSSFVLSIVTCIVGFAGNIIVIFVTGFLMKKKKCKIWFLNLALADFIFLLFLPLHAVSTLLARWPYGSDVCKLYNFFTSVNTYASIYILTALNIDRALSVAKPIWHMRFVSWKVGYGICALIWVLSIVCSIPVIVYSNEHFYSEDSQCLLYTNDITGFLYSNKDENETAWLSIPRDQCDCDFNVVTFQEWIQILSTSRHLIVSLAIVGYVIPLCVILVSNVVIAFHVQNSQTKPSSRLYMVVVTAILVFFSTRTPLLLAQVIFSVAVHTGHFALMYKVILCLPLLSSIAATNTFLNPVVYVLVGKQVRNKISQFFGKLQDDTT
ncbi:chemerin-like receptor 1 [Leptodactylus fuscus]|uniref:chemerin-like receptor 1 n=1 Tax=Leptodactylus fuscus TaxID=238119 RepID=UPI003F4F2DAA